MRLSSIAAGLGSLILIAAASVANAQTVTATSVRLTWTTPGDDSLVGTAAQFDIRYSTSAITAANFAGATRWTAAPVPAAPGTSQNTTVTGLTPSTTYWFAIKTADEVPNWAGISNILTRATLAAPDVTRPAAIANLQITGSTETSLSLSWTATGDDSLTGTATSYDVRYSTTPITDANFAAASPASGEPAPGVAGAAQSFTVNGLTRQTIYYVAIKATDDAGNSSAVSNVPSAATPDLTAPASVRDLAVGFLWNGWRTSASAPAPRSSLAILASDRRDH